ncbi:MAG: hypothetical protein BWY23_00291 [Spirochaetes bacterium ADurb.Bin218]|jgi:predicted Fe-Mo cluster-binding NifX family protein|nr:hypothetical protein [Spirochaetota bacterium]OQB00227.1 MAG: hypothetical protein BWY23_00291 [Spirochaetes bacterium ADurb.Bin218]HOK02008.1 NifB/NifX family molybdenum-iron cluster-binding protein [Spirochaetota bacterium]HOV09478.1 NifB/NifX family molybdenum-iron cluster-binding protein [Spirochaetota bacterium]HPX91066.1 NifB/NifX family molybdenum-iron cluster-binding protein [Spirochaetota bacterium]
MNNELVAIPIFQDRISPLLDEAKRFIIFEISENSITQSITINLDLESCSLRIARLKEMGVTVLISGAVSRFISEMIIDSGIKHYPWNSGAIEEIIDLYIKNKLHPCRASINKCSMQTKGRNCCREKNSALNKNSSKEINK